MQFLCRARGFPPRLGGSHPELLLILLLVALSLSGAQADDSQIDGAVAALETLKENAEAQAAEDAEAAKAFNEWCDGATDDAATAASEASALAREQQLVATQDAGSTATQRAKAKTVGGDLEDARNSYYESVTVRSKQRSENMEKRRIAEETLEIVDSVLEVLEKEASLADPMSGLPKPSSEAEAGASSAAASASLLQLQKHASSSSSTSSSRAVRLLQRHLRKNWGTVDRVVKSAAKKQNLGMIIGVMKGIGDAQHATIARLDEEEAKQQKDFNSLIKTMKGSLDEYEEQYKHRRQRVQTEAGKTLKAKALSGIEADLGEEAGARATAMRSLCVAASGLAKKRAAQYEELLRQIGLAAGLGSDYLTAKEKGHTLAKAPGEFKAPTNLLHHARSTRRYNATKAAAVMEAELKRLAPPVISSASPWAREQPQHIRMHLRPAHARPLRPKEAANASTPQVLQAAVGAPMNATAAEIPQVREVAVGSSSNASLGATGSSGSNASADSPVGAVAPSSGVLALASSKGGRVLVSSTNSSSAAAATSSPPASQESAANVSTAPKTSRVAERSPGIDGTMAVLPSSTPSSSPPPEIPKKKAIMFQRRQKRDSLQGRRRLLRDQHAAASAAVASSEKKSEDPTTDHMLWVMDAASKIAGDTSDYAPDAEKKKEAAAKTDPSDPRNVAAWTLTAAAKRVHSHGRSSRLTSLADEMPRHNVSLDTKLLLSLRAEVASSRAAASGAAAASESGGAAAGSSDDDIGSASDPNCDDEGKAEALAAAQTARSKMHDAWDSHAVANATVFRLEGEAKRLEEANEARAEVREEMEKKFEKLKEDLSKSTEFAATEAADLASVLADLTGALAGLDDEEARMLKKTPNGDDVIDVRQMLTLMGAVKERLKTGLGSEMEKSGEKVLGMAEDVATQVTEAQAAGTSKVAEIHDAKEEAKAEVKKKESALSSAESAVDGAQVKADFAVRKCHGAVLVTGKGSVEDSGGEGDEEVQTAVMLGALDATLSVLQPPVASQI